MKIRIRLLTLSIFILFAQPFRSQNMPAGVLIGVQREAGDLPASAGSLRTVWVPLDQVSAATRIEPIQLSYLLIPRRTGFWHAGLAGTCDEDTVTDFDGKPRGIAVGIIEYFWAAPTGSRGTVHLLTTAKPGACRTKERYCENVDRTTLFWVWPDYVSLNATENTECGVHPDAYLDYGVRSLDAVDMDKSVTDVLGPSAGPPFKTAFDRALREHQKDVGDQCEPNPTSPAHWHIERKNGQWKAIGWQDTHRLCGFGFDFETDLDLSPITGRNDIGRWQQLQKRIPNLTDAHFLPGSSWSLAVTGNKLMVLRGDSDKPVLTLPLSNDEHLIMVEWATGRNVARWTAETRRLQSIPPQEPIMLP